MKSSFFGVSVFFTSLTSFAFAQNSIINGYVKDGENFLPSATISIANKNITANSAGGFSISVPPGKYIFIVTHAGFKKFEQEVTLTVDQTKTILINLTRE